MIVILIIVMMLMTSMDIEAASPTEEYISYIEGVCKTYDVSPELVQSLIFYESS